MMKLILIFLSFFILSGCTINIKEEEKIEKEEEEVLEEEKNIEEKEEISSIGVSSSIDNSLSIGTYGIASKYNAVTSEYKDVDVSIVKIYNNPLEIVSQYNNENPLSIIEKKDGFKYVVLDYEVIFYDFETESFGEDVILDMEVLDTNGNNFVVDGIKQVISINVLANDTGVVNGQKGTVKVVFSIPNDVTNYLVKFGTPEQTIAYYKV